MNLRDLEYITAVAKEKNFARAAEICNVSQPTLSMQIKKLEDYLGVQIFERDNKNFFITDAGEKILARAADALQAAADIKEIASVQKNPEKTSLKIGAFPTLAPYFFPSFVPQVAHEFPDLKLFLVEDKTAVLIDKLKSGAIDAAFLALPVEVENFEFTEIFEDEFFLAVPKNHKFAQRKFVNLQDIARENLLLLEEGHCLRAQALEVCTMIGAGESGDFRATSLETLRQMVASSLGITLMPKVATHESDTRISYVRFKNPKPSRRIGLFWRATSTKKDLLKNLVA